MTREQLLAMTAKHADVPCNGCNACCRSDKIFLSRKDDLTAYAWHLDQGRPTLDRKADGSCTYLTEQGCGIHTSRPDICRRFDCRVLLLLTNGDDSRPQMQHVYAAAQARISTLEGQHG